MTAASFRAAWATDIHLDMASEELARKLCQEARAAAVDCLLLTGDLATAPDVTQWLTLLADEARGTVKHFVALAQKGYFNGLGFHRVVPGFVAQGGDPRGDGWGGPGYTIPCEINPVPYATGAVGMALAGKDTGGSQFFVMHAPHPHLDGRYTVFARVTAGQAAADALLVGDTIERVTLRKR